MGEAEATPADPGRSRRAALLMAAATLFFFGMSLAVKTVGELPTLQVVFFRALVALVLCLVQLRVEGVSPVGTHWRLLLARGAFGTIALLCFFWSLGHLPLATATVLQSLSPLFAVALAVALLGESVGIVQVALFAVAVVGVWLVEGADVAVTPIGVGVAVLGAAFSAGAYAAIAAIGLREHPLVIVLYFPLVTVPLVAPLLPWVWVWPTPGQWGSLLAIGVLVQVAQVFMTRAYQLGPVSVVSLVSYLGVVWAALGGWLLFGEALTPRGGVGLVLVLAAVIGVTRSRRPH